MIDCQKCGACCSYSATWPEVGLDEDQIPNSMLEPNGERMACTRDRCNALRGIVGKRVKCSIYSIRPQVCREFTVNDSGCIQARKWFKLQKLGL